MRIKKPNISIELIPFSGMRGSSHVKLSLAPVLYHGTERFIVEKWRKTEIRNQISLSGDAVHASLYANYKSSFKANGQMAELKSTLSRQFYVSAHQAQELGLSQEFKRLRKGFVIQSLALFDRDALFEAAKANEWLELRADELYALYGSMRIEWKNNTPEDKKVIPSEAMIGSLEFSSLKGTAEFRIFNERLWEANFSVSPPDAAQTRYEKFPYLVYAIFK